VTSEARSALAKLRVSSRRVLCPQPLRNQLIQQPSRFFTASPTNPRSPRQAAEMTKAGHHVTTALNRKGVQEALRQGNFRPRHPRRHPIQGRSPSPALHGQESPRGTKVLVMHAGTHHHEIDAAIDPNQHAPNPREDRRPDPARGTRLPSRGDRRLVCPRERNFFIHKKKVWPGGES
jgi:hypothetical protein